jgi:hypothetical protein
MCEGAFGNEAKPGPGDTWGGYTPFWADVTDLLTARGPQVLVVRAEDDPHDLAKPRGKQDWQLRPHAIWYPRTTGIWQTVWLERVPATRIGHVRWTPCLERWEIGFEARLEGERRDDLRLGVRLYAGDALLADDSYAVIAGEVHRRIALSDPGIDDYRNELLWSPSTPTLIRGSSSGSGTSGARWWTPPRATRRCARSACRGTSSCSTAGRTPCAWCSTRAHCMKV